METMIKSNFGRTEISDYQRISNEFKKQAKKFERSKSVA